MATKKIALIVGSSRSPRAGLPISQLIHKHLSAALPPTISSLDVVDIAAHQLPYLNEPGIPAQADATDPASSYKHAPTKAWSNLISSYSGYVIVTPQYNWGIPAGLKNNLDYLFHEWTGKPVMVVSYGGRGGGKAAENLKFVLKALRMDVVGKGDAAQEEFGDHVELNLGKIEGAIGPAAGEGRLIESVEGAFKEDGAFEKAKKLFGEVVDKVLKAEGQTKA